MMVVARLFAPPGYFAAQRPWRQAWRLNADVSDYRSALIWGCDGEPMGSMIFTDRGEDVR